MWYHWYVPCDKEEEIRQCDDSQLSLPGAASSKSECHFAAKGTLPSIEGSARRCTQFWGNCPEEIRIYWFAVWGGGFLDVWLKRPSFGNHEVRKVLIVSSWRGSCLAQQTVSSLNFLAQDKISSRLTNPTSYHQPQTPARHHTSTRNLKMEKTIVCHDKQSCRVLTSTCRRAFERWGWCQHVLRTTSQQLPKATPCISSHGCSRGMSWNVYPTILASHLHPRRAFTVTHDTHVLWDLQGWAYC